MLSIAQGVWSSPWSKLDQHLPILRLISGVLGRKSVTYLDYLCCRAEEWFARGTYLVKFRSYGITNVQGRGRNGLTLLETFVGHFIELLFWTIFSKDHEHFFFLLLSLFFKKIISCPSWFQNISEGAFEEIWPFWKWIGTQWRFWAELWWNCLAEVDDNTRSR